MVLLIEIKVDQKKFAKVDLEAKDFQTIGKPVIDKLFEIKELLDK